MVKKSNMKSMNYILMYSVLGHPVMIFKAFETKSGAMAHLRQEKNVVDFTIFPIVKMFDYKGFAEDHT